MLRYCSIMDYYNILQYSIFVIVLQSARMEIVDWINVFDVIS